MRKHKCKTGGGSIEEGGQAQGWLQALSAVQICWERQSRAPPQTTAAGLPLQFRGKPHTEIYTGGETATSQRRGQDEEEEKEKRSEKYREEVKRSRRGSLLFLGWKELPGHTALYFRIPFNNLPSASFWSVEHNFAFVKVWPTCLDFFISNISVHLAISVILVLFQYLLLDFTTVCVCVCSFESVRICF